VSTEPQVTKHGVLDMQVCVPAEMEDADVLRFAESQYPCGTTHGWEIRRQGDESLRGASERVPCAQRTGFVHIMLDA